MVTAEIGTVDSVGPQTVAIELNLQEEFEGEPGQFVLVRAEIDETTESGHYTISSSEVTNRFEITVGIDEEGTLGPWFESSEPGTTIEVEGPYGETVFEQEDHVTILAQGPGIGPAVALGELGESVGSDVTIVYLGETVPHRDRLESLEATGTALHLVQDRDDYERVVQDVVPGRTVYVFGYAEFVSLTEDVLEAIPSPVADLKIENFGPE